MFCPIRQQAVANSKCVEGLWPSAKSAGITRATFDRAFQGFTPDPEVIEAANFQPEYVKPVGEYIDRAVSEKRIQIGKQKLVEYQALLGALENRYGVDRTIIVAIWGVELNYGVQPGDKNVIRSLGTLICSGTKSKFARPQLVSALKILQRGDISLEAMNGSWAGAMGHTQFIPTTYTAYAVDHDGDGKRDIWGNIPDALASTASYLKVSNWRRGRDLGLRGRRCPRASIPKTWARTRCDRSANGRRPASCASTAKPSRGSPTRHRLFAPEGARGPAFLMLNNFRSILRYNVAKSYALAVGHLSDRLKGYGPFVHSWPTDETHLSLDQRTEFQQLLIARGILEGEPDGVIGPATLEAVRTYQRAKGLGVDGYPSLTLLKMLRSEAPPTPVGAVPPAQPAAAGEGQPPAAGAGQPAAGQPARRSARTAGCCRAGLMRRTWHWRTWLAGFGLGRLGVSAGRDYQCRPAKAI